MTLPPHIHAEVTRILNHEARRLLDERLKAEALNRPTAADVHPHSDSKEGRG